MKKRFLLFGITLAAMVTSCYGPNDSVYTEELDVVYTQKKDGYDFATKDYFYVADTIMYIDSKGNITRNPNRRGEYEDVTKREAEALIENVKSSMKLLGWDENPNANPTDDGATFVKTAFMDIVISKTTYVGGGYYPGYWYWQPYYYTYSTGSVVVSMFEVNTAPKPGDPAYNLIWENFLSGYTRNGIDVHYVNQGVNQGFRQSQDYLAKPTPRN